MQELAERHRKMQEYFSAAGWPRPDPPPASAGLDRFNLEWHIVPPADVAPFDDRYVDRLYPLAPLDFARDAAVSSRSAVGTSLERFAGTYLAVETTQKPCYLPEFRQSYGTRFGFDKSRDPLSSYFGTAGFTRRSRFGHNYLAVAKVIDIINTDWQQQGLLPAGYRVTICPPAVFNLVGTLFHAEWSETETLELAFHRDAHGNAHCFEVGSSTPGDFSYIRAVETDSEWSLLGFRIALVRSDR